MAMSPIRRGVAVAVASLMVVTGFTLGSAVAAPPTFEDDLAEFTTSVKPKNLFKHLERLQRASDENGGNRAAGLPGYDASVSYVVDKLREAGYRPVVQEFDFPYTEENSELERLSPNPRVFVEGSEFVRNQFDSGTPKGEATGSLFPADVRLDAPALPANTSNSGCEAGDFAGMAAGSVALVQRGTCGFNVKVLNAQAAGAAAVVVMNEGQPGRTGLVGMIGDATGLDDPAGFRDVRGRGEPRRDSRARPSG